MSIEQGFHLNVAKRREPVSAYERARVKEGEFQYTHFFNAVLGDHSQERIMPAVRDLMSKYPEPEFKCSLTKWSTTGQRIDVSEVA